MTASVYLDSSVIVSYLLNGDINHARSKEWLDALRIPLATSVLATVEVGRALARQTSPHEVTEAEKWIRIRVETIDVTDEVRRQANGVRPASLRSLDAIHVATAMWAEVTEFATFDAHQSLAAKEMGLRLAKI